jgi:hypothetical protein
LDPEEQARQLVAKFGGDVEAARRALVGSTNAQDRAILAALGSAAAPATPSAPPASPDEDGGFLKGAVNAARFLGQGATTAALSYAKISPTNLLPGNRANLRRAEARHEELKRDPEGIVENAAYYTGRLAPEFLGTGSVLKGLTQLGVKGAARIGLGNIPTSASFAADKEGALVQSDNPALRFAGEYGANLLAQPLMRYGGRALRGRALGIGSDIRGALRGLRGPGREAAAADVVDELSAPAGDKQAWEMTREEFESQPGTVFHGGRGEYEISTARGTATTGNPTGAFGAFFTPSRTEAERYVSDFHGGQGVVQAARLDLKNPYQMSFKEMDDIIGVDWKKLGFPEGMVELRSRVARIKSALVAAGHDGIVVGVPGKMRPQEIVAFSDASIVQHRPAVERAIQTGRPVPAKVLADYPDLAPTRPPSEAIAGKVDDLTESLRGHTAPGAKKILEEEADLQRRALNVARQAEVNPDDYMNVEKFGVDDEGKDRIRAIARRVIVEEGRIPKETVTNEQTIREAFGLSREDVLTAHGRDLNRVEFLASKNFIAENDAAADALRRQLADQGLPVRERVRIEAKIEAIDAESRAIWSPYSKTHSEQGRALQAAKISAQNSTDPFAWYHRADKMLDGRPLTDEIRRTIRNLLEAGDRAGLVDYVTGLRKPTIAEWLTTVWKAVLLANPAPHIANIIGNTTMKALETAKEVPGFVVDRAMGAVTGIEGKARPGTGIGRSLARAGQTFLEREEKFTADFLQILPFSKKGFRRPTLAGLRERAAGQYAEMSRLAQDDPGLGKLDQHRNIKFNNAFLDAGVNVVFRLLGDADAVFSQAAAVQSLAQSARVEAKRGLGQGDTFLARLRHLDANPTDEMVFQALADAEYNTYRDRTALGSFVGGTKRLAEIFGGQLGRIAAEGLAPFTKTPTSVAIKVGIDYTPLGLTRALRGLKHLPDRETRAMYRLARKALSERPATYEAHRQVQLKIVNAMARSITGSAAPIALGIYLASQADEIITGPLPENAAERQQFWAEGKQPWSVKIGGQWRSMERVSPGGNLLMTGAGIYFAWKDKGLTAADKALKVASTTTRMLAEQPFLTGTKTALDLLTDPESRSLSKFGGGYAASAIPGGIRAIARGVDPTIREPEGIAQQVQASIPYASRSLPARIDQLGEEVRRPSGVGGQMLDIFKSSPDKLATDPLLRALNNAGVTFGERDRREGETAKQFEVRMRREGATLKEYLEEEQRYGNITKDNAKVIQQTIENLRTRMTKQDNWEMAQ